MPGTVRYGNLCRGTEDFDQDFDQDVERAWRLVGSPDPSVGTSGYDYSVSADPWMGKVSFMTGANDSRLVSRVVGLGHTPFPHIGARSQMGHYYSRVRIKLLQRRPLLPGKVVPERKVALETSAWSTPLSALTLGTCTIRPGT